MIHFDLPHRITKAEDIRSFMLKWDMGKIMESTRLFKEKWDLNLTGDGA